MIRLVYIIFRSRELLDAFFWAAKDNSSWVHIWFSVCQNSFDVCEVSVASVIVGTALSHRYAVSFPILEKLPISFVLFWVEKPLRHLYPSEVERSSYDRLSNIGNVLKVCPVGVALKSTQQKPVVSKEIVLFRFSLALYLLGGPTFNSVSEVLVSLFHVPCVHGPLPHSSCL